MVKGGTVYILTNKSNKVLYTGVTSDLFIRITQHREHKYPHSFTAKYKVTKLVFFESYACIEEAIKREKQIKGGSRIKKVKLINKDNANWRDLYEDVQKW